MTFLHSLYTVTSGRNAQREGALGIGDDDLLIGIVHHVAVELERYTWYGNRGVTIEHITRIDVVVVHVVVESLCPVAVLVEVNFASRVRTSITTTLNRNHVGTSTLIG